MELALLKPKFYLTKRPTYLLGLFICIFPFFVAGASFWAKEKGLFDLVPPKNINWPVIYSAAVALMGWLVTSYIAARNSIKQHTITTLLQTRLSAEYMKHALALNDFVYFKKVIIDSAFMEELKALETNEEESIAPEKKKYWSVYYILNYMEFVSAGIRCGDFDELLVKKAQKQMYLSLYKAAVPLIEELRVNSPTSFEHFIQVCKRWEKLTFKERLAKFWDFEYKAHEYQPYDCIKVLFK